ncbi:MULTISPECIES: HD-GYP domain-containing protein [unclassified Marinitoga]|uniref:HD-GYP domain-containing protein n=1 Tax=unclassified Marinitoga TaxID=2640159 RepID=UPI000658C00B|nr:MULTISPECIES: HD-GYP domain-containing protein [unclassified Marinitoga]KLO23378.1 hypothetical protein X274_06595 [Marinitoga sp. 1155]
METDKKYTVKKLKKSLEDAYKKLEYSYKELEEINNRFIKVVDLISNISLEISIEKYFDKMLSIFVELLPDIKFGCVLKSENEIFRFISVLGHSKKLYYNIVILNEEFDEIKIVDNFYRKHLKNFDIVKDKIIDVKDSLIIPMKTFALHGYIILDLLKKELKPYEFELIRVISNIATTFLMSRELYNKQKNFLKNTAFAFLKAVDYYDPYTKGHSERVSYYATSLVKVIGREDLLNDIFLASVLHDIGKLSIPQVILLKNDRLTEEELNKIKEHPVKGEELVSSFEGFEKIGKIIRHHHERYDGTGYPDGLIGEKIPMESRIITIVDAFDAMTTKRPYRKALTVNEAIKELKKNRGLQFDPFLAGEFIKFLKINKFFNND